MPPMEKLIPSMTVGKLAKAAGVGLSTIRYYERRGLVLSLTRRSSGYREYDLETLRRVRFIRHAQELGFTLQEIGALLKLRVTPGSDCAAVRARATAKLADVKTRLVELERLRDALTKLVAACPACGPVTHCTILDALDTAVEAQSLEPARANRRRKHEDPNMKSLDLKIKGMHCKGCASTIEALLMHHTGIKSASVSFDQQRGRMLYDPAMTDAALIATAIQQAGYVVLGEPGTGAA